MRLVGYLREQGVDWPEDGVRAAAPIVQEKIARLDEFAGFAGFLFHDVEPDPGAARRAYPRLRRDCARRRRAVEAAAIEAALKRLCDELGEKPRTVYLPIRVAVTGSRVSPGLYESLELLGKEPSLARIRAGLRGDLMSAIGELVGVELGPTEWHRGLAGADRRLRGGDRRPAVDPVGPRARRRRAVRDDDRARLPHPLALRPDAVRGARRPRPAAWSSTTVSIASASRRRSRPAVGSAAASASRRSSEKPLGERGVIEATVECEGVDKPVCVAELVVLTVP